MIADEGRDDLDRERIFREQDEWIRKNLGNEALEEANYTWKAVNPNEIVMRIVGHGILITRVKESGELEHFFAPSATW